MLERANFTNGDSSSKLHVLTSCERYLRSLQDRSKCYEMEAKLRSAASGNQCPADGDSLGAGSGSNKDINWATSGDQALPPDEGRIGESDNLGDECSSSRGTESSGGSNPKVPAFFDEENSVGSAGLPEGGSFVGAIPPASSAAESAAVFSVEDGETGSTDSGGADTSAGTTDSGSQGFTTDTASRGFTTDSGYMGSSLSVDSGSADSGDTGSGDAGSADGGSDGSEEGETGARMRVVNYFDIFRLSNVPMAIANKDGALVDVNDAMRGFGRIRQDIVRTLTVKSLVAPESSKVSRKGGFDDSS